MADSPVIFNAPFEKIMDSVTLRVFDLLHTGVAFISFDGYFGYCNKAFLKMYQLPEDVIGRHIGDFFLVDKESLPQEIASPKMIISLGQSRNNIYGILFRYPIYDLEKVFRGVVIESLPCDIGRDRLRALLENMRTLEMKTFPPKKQKYNKSNELYTFDGMIGESPAMVNLRLLGYRFALSDEPVLIRGETGTGKELVAHALHSASNRANAPFVSVNCAALPPDLIVSELFGYEAGAFTGGRAGGMKGKFEEANGGTIFLDEIGELPLSAQAKLLRVLESGEIQKLGHKGLLQSNFRLIGATNRDLAQMVRQNQFRQDLYHRLSVFELNVPPLRERGNDVFLLTRHYLEQYLEDASSIRLDPEMEKIFRHYSWPGNIRELKNTVVYALYSLNDGQKLIAREHLPQRLLLDLDDDCGIYPPAHNWQPSQAMSSSHTETTDECQQLQYALERQRYNKVNTAKALGISRSKLYRLLRKCGLQD